MLEEVKPLRGLYHYTSLINFWCFNVLTANVFEGWVRGWVYFQTIFSSILLSQIYLVSGLSLNFLPSFLRIDFLLSLVPSKRCVIPILLMMTHISLICPLDSDPSLVRASRNMGGMCYSQHLSILSSRPHGLSAIHFRNMRETWKRSTCHVLCSSSILLCYIHLILLRSFRSFNVNHVSIFGYVLLLQVTHNSPQ